MENEYLIGQFIGKTQKNMIESVNIRSSYFGEKWTKSMAVCANSCNFASSKGKKGQPR